MKIVSSAEVFLVEDNEGQSTLRLIPTEEVAKQLAGENWADYVIDVPPMVYSHFEHGEAMTGAGTIDTSLLKRRVELRIQ